MMFKESYLKGAYIISLEKLEDERGFFARSFCKDEFRAAGLDMDVVQCNISYNKKRGTLRGMHFQCAPYEERKLVSCTRGSIFDVIIDLRKESETYLEWEGFYLNQENHHMLYIPIGFAHGFCTLDDNSEVLYQMSEFYHPECARGVRWDDPEFDIQWPANETYIVSSRDNNIGLWKDRING